jgi:hypothetical protein
MSDKLASFRRRTSQRAAEMTGQAAECKDEQFDVMEEQGHIHKQIVHDIRKEMDAHIQAVSEFIRTGLNVSQNIHMAFQTNTNSDPYLSSLKALSIWTALQDDFEKRAKNLYMTSVLGSMDTYIRELDQVKDLSSMRNKAAQEYEYYRRKVEDLKLKPPKDANKLPRNQVKLEAAQQTLNSVTVWSHTQKEHIDREKAASLNCPWLHVLSFQVKFSQMASDFLRSLEGAVTMQNLEQARSDFHHRTTMSAALEAHGPGSQSTLGVHTFPLEGTGTCVSSGQRQGQGQGSTSTGTGTGTGAPTGVAGIYHNPHEGGAGAQGGTGYASAPPREYPSSGQPAQEQQGQGQQAGQGQGMAGPGQGHSQGILQGQGYEYQQGEMRDSSHMPQNPRNDEMDRQRRGDTSDGAQGNQELSGGNTTVTGIRLGPNTMHREGDKENVGDNRPFNQQGQQQGMGQLPHVGKIAGEGFGRGKPLPEHTGADGQASQQQASSGVANFPPPPPPLLPPPNSQFDSQQSGSQTGSNSFKAKLDYQPSDPRMLKIRAGEVLHKVREENGWFYGSNQHGETGFFPPAFVSPMPTNEMPSGTAGGDSGGSGTDGYHRQILFET